MGWSLIELIAFKIKLWGIGIVAVFLRAFVQQLIGDLRVQERRPVRYQQEEPNVMQSLSAPKVSSGGNVQERLPLRQTLQLVQTALPDAGTGTDVGPVQHQRRQSGVDGRQRRLPRLETQLPSSSRYHLVSLLI